MESGQTNQFGKYRLLRRLGAGGMAEVFLAEQEGPGGFGRSVAIKRMFPHLSERADFTSWFISEARLGGRLSHPNIVSTVEFGEQGGHYFLVMEYVEGVTLSRLLAYSRRNRERIPLNIALDIAIQVCDGLAYAHQASDHRGQPLRMIHRDLKPANILLSTYGTAKIADFGAAKASSNVHLTAASLVKGTLSYMSPEQAGGADKLDNRSDLYSLGAILFEMLTLEHLYPSVFGLSRLAQVQTGRVLERLSLLAGQPPALLDLLTRLLAFDREDRPATANEVRQILKRVEVPVTRHARELRDLVGAAMQVEAQERPARVEQLASVAGGSSDLIELEPLSISEVSPEVGSAEAPSCSLEIEIEPGESDERTVVSGLPESDPPSYAQLRSFPAVPPTIGKKLAGTGVPVDRGGMGERDLKPTSGKKLAGLGVSPAPGGEATQVLQRGSSHSPEPLTVPTPLRAQHPVQSTAPGSVHLGTPLWSATETTNEIATQRPPREEVTAQMQQWGATYGGEERFPVELEMPNYDVTGESDPEATSAWQNPNMGASPPPTVPVNRVRPSREHGTAATSPPSSGPASSSGHRRKFPVVLALVCGLFLTAGVGWFLGQTSEPGHERREKGGADSQANVPDLNQPLAASTPSLAQDEMGPTPKRVEVVGGKASGLETGDKHAEKIKELGDSGLPQPEDKPGSPAGRDQKDDKATPEPGEGTGVTQVNPDTDDGKIVTASAGGTPAEQSTANSVGDGQSPNGAADCIKRLTAPPIGALSLPSDPYAFVTIDGCNIGETTPLLEFALTAGRHSVTLRTVDGRKTTLKVDIVASETMLHPLVELK